MSLFTSFGLVYLTEFFGYKGALIMTTPLIIGFLWGVRHFEKLENLRGPHNDKMKNDYIILSETKAA